MIKNTRKGFTLIELLIVVAIIGILASVVLVGLGPIQKRGRDARRISDMKQIQTGLELWYGANGRYPAAAGATWVVFKGLAGWAPVGVTNLPQDPSAARSYRYCTDAAGLTYTLAAALEDTSNPVLAGDIDAALPADCTSAVGAPASCIDGFPPGPAAAPFAYCVQL